MMSVVLQLLVIIYAVKASRKDYICKHMSRNQYKFTVDEGANLIDKKTCYHTIKAGHIYFFEFCAIDIYQPTLTLTINHTEHRRISKNFIHHACVSREYKMPPRVFNITLSSLDGCGHKFNHVCHFRGCPKHNTHSVLTINGGEDLFKLPVCKYSVRPEWPFLMIFCVDVSIVPNYVEIRNNQTSLKKTKHNCVLLETKLTDGQKADYFFTSVDQCHFRKSHHCRFIGRHETDDSFSFHDFLTNPLLLVAGFLPIAFWIISIGVGVNLYQNKRFCFKTKESDAIEQKPTETKESPVGASLADAATHDPSRRQSSRVDPSGSVSQFSTRRPSSRVDRSGSLSQFSTRRPSSRVDRSGSVSQFPPSRKSSLAQSVGTGYLSNKRQSIRSKRLPSIAETMVSAVSGLKSLKVRKDSKAPFSAPLQNKSKIRKESAKAPPAEQYKKKTKRLSLMFETPKVPVFKDPSKPSDVKDANKPTSNSENSSVFSAGGSWKNSEYAESDVDYASDGDSEFSRISERSEDEAMTGNDQIKDYISHRYRQE